MSDKEIKQFSPEEITLARDGPSVDWFLQSLVSIVNDNPLEFGITLFVGGVTISGQLVSGKKYFETFAKEFSDAYPGKADTQEGIRQAFASHTAIYDRREDEEVAPPPQFIHLINCRCFSPGGVLPSNRGILWRGKINAVSGFSLGSISSD
jgi:hypothetical protein